MMPINGVLTPVPCGKCVPCLMKKRQDWFLRLVTEAEDANTPMYMITLTYDNEHLPHDELKVEYFDEQLHRMVRRGTGRQVSVVCKQDIDLFVKRLNNNIRYEYRKRGVEVPKDKPLFRFYIASEYGKETHRPHYHGLLFDFPPEFATSEFILKAWGKCTRTKDVINQCYSDGAVNYVSKYLLFKSKDYGKEPNFFRSSRRPAIGSSYLNRKSLIDWHRQSIMDNSYMLIKRMPIKFPMPDYYYRKIYTDEERKARADYYREHAEEEFRLLRQYAHLMELFRFDGWTWNDVYYQFQDAHHAQERWKAQQRSYQRLEDKYYKSLKSKKNHE